jgi:hypothetical protein
MNNDNALLVSGRDGPRTLDLKPRQYDKVIPRIVRLDNVVAFMDNLSLTEEASVQLGHLCRPAPPARPIGHPVRSVKAYLERRRHRQWRTRGS